MSQSSVGSLAYKVGEIQSLTQSERSGYFHLICGCYVFLFQFFIMDVVVNFSRLSEDDLYTQLDRIATMADEEEENAEFVGILTADYRDKWAVARMHLMEGNIFVNI